MLKALQDKYIGVVGLGKTGYSCVRFLKKHGVQVSVFDTREKPPLLDSLLRDFPDVEVTLGALPTESLCLCDEILLSPGLPLSDPAIQVAMQKGIPVRGDIDLFARFADAPIAAITGSNGKSTVTSLLGKMAEASGIKVAVGGNIGTPALDLVEETVELYVLELSSFQLETTYNLGAECAVILNISEDHMDRYESRAKYLQAKQRIFQNCRSALMNDDDLLTSAVSVSDAAITHFGLDQQEQGKFYAGNQGDGDALYKGFDRLILASELKLRGRHNLANALAALAMGDKLGFSMHAMLAALREYEGLPHRCQWVRNLQGVDYINDSKGTNVGASRSAIESFGSICRGDVLLIAGGEGKSADFTPLREALSRWGRFAALFGKDKAEIGKALSGVVETVESNTLGEALAAVRHQARQGDVVLFSPACASFDMYANFEARGNDFIAEVMRL